MSTQTMEKEYPSDWDAVENKQSEASKYLKLKSGEKCRLHIIQGPLATQEVYVVTGKDEKGNEVKKHIVLPKTGQLPGHKLKATYTFEVVVLDGAMNGRHIIWSVGQRLAEDLLKAKGVWGSITTPDFVLERQGEKLSTKWTLTAAPATIEVGDHPAEYDFAKEIVYSTAADLQSLPPVTAGSVASDDMIVKITGAQAQLISGICDAKDLTADWVCKTIARKFPPKSEVDQLTSKEASALIDVLKGI